MFTRKIALIVCTAAAAAVLAASALQARTPLTVSNNLTFGSRVALPGVTLPAGSYVFERDVDANSRIVRVMSTNYQQLLFVGFTTPVTRPRGFKAAVSFGEGERDQPLPIVAWYPVGSNRGYQFLYR